MISFNHAIIPFLRRGQKSSSCVGLRIFKLPKLSLSFFGLTFGVGDKAGSLIDVFFPTEKL